MARPLVSDDRSDSVKNAPSNGSAGNVPAIARAVRVLECIAANDTGLRLADLSRQLGIAKSSTHAICTALDDVGWLRRTDDGVFHLGPGLLSLADSYLAAIDPVRHFTEHANSVSGLSHETLVLAILDGAEVVYIATRGGQRSIGVSYRVGLRLPANCTASGKAILSTMAESDVRELFSAHSLPGLTDHSIRDIDQLLVELDRCRERGYAIDDEETALGMLCVAAPVGGARQDMRAAVSVTMVKARSAEGASAAYGVSVRQLADLLAAGA